MRDLQTGSDWRTSASSGYHSGVSTSEISLGERAALNASLAADEDSDDDSVWNEDEWPVDRPLPLPEWGCGRPEVTFNCQQQYKIFLVRVGYHLRRALASLPYDTISNFIAFGKSYLSSREDYPALLEFYRDYDPPVLTGRYTCVGLSSDLATRLSVLEAHYPGLKDATYPVSCEEEVTELESFSSLKEPVVARCLKEHVLLCVRIRVAGRAGVLLFDPGYHVGEPITVMEDGLSPQSGPIKGCSARSDVHRTFQYSFWQDNYAFVSWRMVEEREGKPNKCTTSVIHVSRPFLSTVDIAERRNLVEPFKSLLGRDAQGNLICGLYFPTRTSYNTSVTFFHKVNGLVRHVKRPLSYFLVNDEQSEVEEALAAIADQTGRPSSDLRSSLVTLARLLLDEDLVKQVLELNHDIEEMTKE